MHVPIVSCLAWLPIPAPAIALVGFEQRPYDPVCAYACASNVGTNLLSCSSMMTMTDDMMMDTPSTTPECYASDTGYLTTMAWCLSTHCAPYNVPNSSLELYWEGQVTGDPTVLPKWSYAQALQNVAQPPTRVLGSEDVLDFTALADNATWIVQFDTLGACYREEALHAKFGYAYS